MGVFLIKRIIVILCHRIDYTAGKLSCGIDRKNGQKVAIEKGLFQDIDLPFLMKSTGEHFAFNPAFARKDRFFHW